MNCTIDYVNSFILEEDIWFGVFSSVILLLSIILLVVGQKILRLSTFLASTIVVAYFTFYLLTFTFLECGIRIVITCVSAVAAGLLVLCLFRFAKYLLGIVAGGSLGHLIYTSLITLPVEPAVWGISVYYLSSLGGGAILGFIISCTFLAARILSSLLASLLVLVFLSYLFVRIEYASQEWIFPTVVGVCTLLGTVLQTVLLRKRCKKKLPIGIPVTQGVPID